MNILGISAYYHDSAAALVVDGEIVAAAQEERFTRKKHDYRFPENALKYCLEEGGINESELNYVIFYDKPLLKFERLLETYIACAPRGFKQFFIGLPIWLRQKLFLPRELKKALHGNFKRASLFCEHHESHAASAFFPSPYKEAAILTFDGVGEWATASYGYGKENSITITHELHFPHSLGLLYSAFTYYTGFRVNSGEYKLMGLAPYGKPKYYDLIMDKLIDLKEDGTFRLNMDYFAYCYGTVMTSAKFDKLFGGKARKPEEEITQHQMDIAASIQKVIEQIVIKIAGHVHEETGMENLVMAGGVALNCVANGRLLREGPFKSIWIQPAAGDAGGALGAALFVWYQLLDNPRHIKESDFQKGSLLGPSFNDDEVCVFLDQVEAKYHRYLDEDELLSSTAKLISEEKVVGWFQGRMEFGPRALGSRSILGDARSEEMQSVMNLKIKFRESFRPFAPCVLKEDASEYFQVKPEDESPYMLFVTNIQESKRKNYEQQQHLHGIEKLKVARSCIPAVTHVDCSARVQTVDEQRNPKLYKMMRKFKEITGCPVVINTSFNIRGEPIVCTPEDAYKCFMGTNMDVLVMGNVLLYKKEQPNKQENQAQQYISQFELD
jgi:carbamoyltransferase